MDFSYLTVLPRGRQIWDYAVFPAEEFDARRGRLAKLLEDLKLDGFIVYSDALSRRYVSYLTNYCNSVSWSCSVSLVTADEPPRVISSMAPRDINYNLKSLSPNVELNAIGLGMLTNHKVAPKAVEYMREHGLMEKKWGGVNLSSLNLPGQEAIFEAFPTLPDCTASFDEILSVKSSAEMFAMTQAATIAQKAVLDYLRMAVPGENEREIAARVDRQCRVYGVDNVALLVCAGQNAPMNLHQPRDYVIQEGDTVSAHVDILYLHYNGVFAASMYRGVPDAGRASFYAGAQACYEQALDAIRAGKSLDGVNSRQDDGYTLAAGIGADVSESPFAGPIGESCTFGLTMCRKSETYGDVIFADTFAVEASGPRSLGAPGMDRVYRKG